MEGVSAGFCDHIDHCPGILAIFRAVIAGLYAELLEGIGIREWLVDVGVLVNIVAAVELITDLVLACTVHCDLYRAGEGFGRPLVGASEVGLRRAGSR